LGAAILLGAALAPTDPVLASDVQVKHSADQDGLRYALTAEASLNDGTAFPFVMLGLGLLGLHDIGAGGWKWWTVDLAWAVAAGLAIGAILGTAVGRLVLFLRLRHREAIGIDNFLGVGLIALSYGSALMANAYGFLAVFAAGLSLRLIETRENSQPPSKRVRQLAGASDHLELATNPKTAHAYMAEAVLNFNNQLDRFAEVGLVVLLGALLRLEHLRPELLWLAPLMLLVIRPVAVAIGLAGEPMSGLERGMIGWFGIRGIGSLYYLMFAIARAVPSPLDEQLVSYVLVIVAVSIVLHGITVQPLVHFYERRSDTRPS
jgi:NhaP-type Na+/H+ or K+/H+ antiporter